MTAMQLQWKERFSGPALALLFVAVLATALLITYQTARAKQRAKAAGTVWQTRQSKFPKPTKPQTVVPIVYLRSV